MKSVRVTGVYNSDIVMQLLAQGIRDIGFDIRPRSFNFIQLDAIHKILNEIPASNLKFFLRFENDKDFVVRELVDKLTGHGVIPGENLWVEYWGSETVEFCEQVGLPYIKLLHDQNFQNWLSSSQLQGFVVNEMFLNSLGLKGDSFAFLGNFFDALPKEFIVDLSLDWNSEISKSLLEFYPFNNLCFHIDNQVENSYRNVNLQLIKQHIEHTQRLLTQI